jgi:muramoyltetrapeptide carboxypeptidase
MAAKTSPVEPWPKAKALRPFDSVAVIAPSGPVPAARLAVGLGALESRYRVEKTEGLLQKRGFLAGDDGRRLAELRWALSDPQVQAVFCARGGHGVLRLLPSLLAAKPDELPQRPLVGFSDITVLHALLARHRRVTIHGPVVTQLGELPESDRAALWALLESPQPPPPLLGLLNLSASTRAVTGRLLGGNLEVLSRLCGTPLCDSLLHSGPVVLLIEEVTEAPYRIDRALTHLRHAGALDRVVAAVIGDLLRCEGPVEHPSALEVISERLGGLGIPVLAGVPLGHGARNRAVPLGVAVHVDPRRGCVEFLDSVVD